MVDSKMPPPKVDVSYAWQLRDGQLGWWSDLANFESYDDALHCGIDAVPGKVRLVRRTTTETVLP